MSLVADPAPLSSAVCAILSHGRAARSAHAHSMSAGLLRMRLRPLARHVALAHTLPLAASVALVLSSCEAIAPAVVRAIPDGFAISGPFSVSVDSFGAPSCHRAARYSVTLASASSARLCYR